MTLANQLTIFRIGLVPGVVLSVVYGYFGAALIVFLIAGLTDALDGLAARLRNEKTELGAMLDPLADKALVTAALIVLSVPSTELVLRVPAWLAILSIGRDAGILLAALVYNLIVERRAFRPSLLGKATTLVHLLMILWVIWNNFVQAAPPWASVVFGVTAAFVVSSGLEYLYRARSLFS